MGRQLTRRRGQGATESRTPEGRFEILRGADDAVPEPGEDDRSGFAEAGGDVDELGFAGATGVAAGQA